MDHLLEEANLKSFFATLPFHTKSGSTAISSFFSSSPSSKKDIARRTNTVLEVRDINKNPHNKAVNLKLWSEIKRTEEIIDPYIDSANDLTEQTESELFFTGTHTKVFNTFPFLITILLILKIWVGPVLGLMTPLLFIIAPYIIIKLFMNLPIPWEVYLNMMKEVVLGIRADQPVGLKQLSQGLYLLTSFGQGMVQPILTAQQTYKTDCKIKEIGLAVNEYIYASTGIFDKLFAKTSLHKRPPLPMDLSPRDAYWWLRENQMLFKSWRNQVGCMDVYMTFALKNEWIPVLWSETDTFKFDGLADLCISKPKKSTIEFGGHSIITGPNRGGKSSFLRAVLQQVLFARIMGLTNCTSASLPWVSWIHSRIRSLDTPGEASLFEEDVKSCAGILNKLSPTRYGLVVIDELFHSTNPPDALFCAKTFLGSFWKTNTVTSLISTHSFELLETLPSHVDTLCFPAETNEKTGLLDYSYVVDNGVCMKSSVREVLQEAGFVLSKAA